MSGRKMSGSTPGGTCTDEWTEEAGQVTPTLKLKRNVVMKEYSAAVESLYAK